MINLFDCCVVFLGCICGAVCPNWYFSFIL